MADGATEPAGRLDRPTAVWLAALALLAFARTALLAPERIATQAFDDACYFAAIAANVVAGRGFTFDRIHPTNGYQPLWEWLLIPVQALPLPPEQRFVAGLLLQVVLLAGAGVLLFRTLARLVPGTPLLPAAALFGGLVFLECVNGMETATQIGAMALLLWAGARWQVLERPRVLPAFAFGLLLSVVLLARLDGIFIALALGIVALAGAWRDGGRRAARVRALAGIVAGALVGFGPYLAYNRFAFGAFVPVSGIIKSSFPHPHLHGGPLQAFGVRGILHLVLGAGFVLHYLAGLARESLRPAGERTLRAALLVAALGMGLHAVHALLFMKWAAFRWHYLWWALVSSLVLVELARSLVAWRPATRGVVTLAGAAMALLFVAQAARREARPPAYDWHRAVFEAARWTRGHVPEDAVMAMTDAGAFGYFSGRRVVNLDGVVNTVGYQDTIRDQHWSEYLGRCGVTYLVKHDFGHFDYGDSADIHTYDHVFYRVKGHRDDVWSDRTWLFHANEVYRTREFVNDGKTVVTAIWRWDGRRP